MYVETVNITGNDNLPDGDILKFMSTRPAGALPWLTGAGTYRPATWPTTTSCVPSSLRKVLWT